jgi:hypothetical protein
MGAPLLCGNAGGNRVVRELPREEIASAQRVARHERLSGFSSLRLDLHTGRSLLLASVMGIGALFDILDALSRGV